MLLSNVATSVFVLVVIACAAPDSGERQPQREANGELRPRSFLITSERFFRDEAMFLEQLAARRLRDRYGIHVERRHVSCVFNAFGQQPGAKTKPAGSGINIAEPDIGAELVIGERGEAGADGLMQTPGSPAQTPFFRLASVLRQTPSRNRNASAGVISRGHGMLEDPREVSHGDALQLFSAVRPIVGLTSGYGHSVNQKVSLGSGTRSFSSSRSVLGARTSDEATNRRIRNTRVNR